MGIFQLIPRGTVSKIPILSFTLSSFKLYFLSFRCILLDLSVVFNHLLIDFSRGCSHMHLLLLGLQSGLLDLLEDLEQQVCVAITCWFDLNI